MGRPRKNPENKKENNKKKPKEIQINDEQPQIVEIPKKKEIKNVKVNHPFEVYLEKVKEGKFWKNIDENKLQKAQKNIASAKYLELTQSRIKFAEFEESALNCIEDYGKSVLSIENENNGINDENEENDINDNDESFQEFSVEKIVSKNVINGIVKYECKWLNYPSSDNTWEKIQNLDNSLILVKNFENSLLKDPKGLIRKYIDPSHAFRDTVWKTLKHLQEIDKILSYDTYSGFCWVAFKNIGETAAIHVNKIKEKHPKIWLDFFRENREKFFRGRITPHHILYRQHEAVVDPSSTNSVGPYMNPVNQQPVPSISTSTFTHN